MSTAEFTNSPLTEVVLGVEFNAQDFSSVHFGLYWQTIQERFPNHPLDRPPIGEIEVFNILRTLPRVWFESEDNKQLIQLQANRFYYNWRQTEKTDIYPHFEEIYPKFLDEWEKLQAWWVNIETTPLQPIRYELSYVNQIDRDFGWNNASDHPKIFRFLDQNWGGFSLTPNSFNANLEFELEANQGTLVVNLTQGIRPQDNMPVIIVNLTASSANTSMDIKKWFDLAHQSTVKLFLSLINQEIQQEWGFKWSQ